MPAPRLFTLANALNLLLVFLPAALILEGTHAGPVWIFTASGLAIIPLAGLMGKATEHLAEQVGEGIGGLLNAAFGNAAELIIALMALRAGLYDVVKASLGGLRFPTLRFNRTAASLGSTLLTLTAIGLVVPAIFHFVARGADPTHEQELSLEIAVVLFAVYLLSLLFTLRTHAHLYLGRGTPETRVALGTASWSRRKSVTLLLLATAGVALMSALLVGSVEHAAATLGMTEVFVGVILVAIIGNAAEHSTAVLMAMKGKMDLAVNIAVGSSLQIALFVAPLLVFLSYLFRRPMDLLFTPFEILAVALSVLIFHQIASDGESNWMEGVLLLAVYLILGMAFYFLPH
jgi:Ca2+:H+ antiporter